MDKFELKMKIDDLERLFYQQVGKTSLLFDLLAYKIKPEDNVFPMLQNIYNSEFSKQQEIYVKLQSTIKIYEEALNKKGK